MEMDNDNLRRMIREPNFFHHCTQPYLPHGVESLGNPSLVVRAGVVFLNRCKSLEPIEYDNRWKGTPFYWIGSAAFLAHDYETAAFLYDASASEDMREVREGEHPPGRITPAIRFLLVQGDQADQAAQALTQHLQTQLDVAINDYNGRQSTIVPQLTLAEIRTHFLQRLLEARQDTTLVTAFISYFLEWHHRSGLVGLGIRSGSAEPFVLHLFKGCLLFESLLRSNPTQRQSSPDTLGDLLQTFHKELAIPAQRRDRKSRLGIDIERRDIDFQTVLAAVASADRSIATAVAMTDLTRNTLGHRLDWEVQFDKGNI